MGTTSEEGQGPPGAVKPMMMMMMMMIMCFWELTPSLFI
jgi:hypothetical protein